jgi:tetratricopeptide (TPR) repeat protein
VHDTGDDVEAKAEAQFRSSYFYALACLAGLDGDRRDQEQLLARALESDPDSPLLKRERGDALVELGRAPEAAALMRQALEASPQDLELRRQLSRIYQQAGKIEDARALFLGPAGRDPDDPEWLRSLVALDIVAGDFDVAERRLRSLLAVEDRLDDRDLLAMTLEQRKHFAEAAQEFRAVVAKDASRTASWGRLADCEDALGDTGQARAALEGGIKANPDSPLLEDQLGRLLYRVGDYPGAEKAFADLAEEDPTDTHALLFKGLAQLKNGKYKDAEEALTGLGQQDKDDPDQAYALGLARMMLKDETGAEEQYRTVLKLNPRAEGAWAELAYVLERQKRKKDARETLRQGLKVLPSSEELALLYASSQEEDKDLGGAVETLRTCLSLGGGDDARFQLAVLLDKKGDFAGAEKELNTLITESPKNAQALNYLGYSWVDRGEHLAEAESLIRRALEVEPDNRYFQDSLGWAQFKQGALQDALGTLTQAAANLEKHSADWADTDEAVVYEHLAAVQKALGDAASGQRSLARAQEVRHKILAQPPTDDVSPEPGL